MSIGILIGKTLTGVWESDNMIIFTCSDGTKYKMYHSQEGCEDVYIDDICGDMNDLIGSEIVKAEEATNSDIPPQFSCADRNMYVDDTFTWTFYHIATIKGYVTIRWFGTSNGYYSESVEFEEITNEQQAEKD